MAHHAKTVTGPDGRSYVVVFVARRQVARPAAQYRCPACGTDNKIPATTGVVMPAPLFPKFCDAPACEVIHVDSPTQGIRELFDFEAAELEAQGFARVED